MIQRETRNNLITGQNALSFKNMGPGSKRELRAFPLYQANATHEDRKENSAEPKMLRIIQLVSHTEQTSVAGNWHFRTITKFQALRSVKVKMLPVETIC